MGIHKSFKHFKLECHAEHIYAFAQWGGDFCWLINGQWTVNTFKSLTLRLLMPYIYNISSLRVNEYLKNSECCSLLRCYLPSFIFYFIFFRENCATMVFSRIKISSFYVILLNWTRATSYYFRIFENPFFWVGGVRGGSNLNVSFYNFAWMYTLTAPLHSVYTSHIWRYVYSQRKNTAVSIFF